MGNAIAADKSYCSRGAKSIVAQNSLLIERSCCGRRPGVCVVVHHLVAQCRNRKGVTGRAHVGSCDRRSGDRLDGRRGIRVRAIRRVVGFCEGCRRNHGRIQIIGICRHERVLVAEVAVIRIELRISDQLSSGRGTKPRIEDWARVVHTSEHHPRRISGRVGRVDLPR